MAAALVPLVLSATFAFDKLPPGASLTTTLVRRMPTFAWRSAVAIVRVESNSMVAAVHKFSVRLVEAAPTSEDPDEPFGGALWGDQSVTPSDPAGVPLLLALDDLPPFADLEIQQLNVGATMPAGAVGLSIDLLVRGRHFDRVHPPGGRDSDHAP